MLSNDTAPSSVACKDGYSLGSSFFGFLLIIKKVSKPAENSTTDPIEMPIIAPVASDLS